MDRILLLSEDNVSKELRCTYLRFTYISCLHYTMRSSTKHAQVAEEVNAFSPIQRGIGGVSDGEVASDDNSSESERDPNSKEGAM